jgi:hypothetical protein
MPLCTLQLSSACLETGRALSPPKFSAARVFLRSFAAIPAFVLTFAPLADVACGIKGRSLLCGLT